MTDLETLLDELEPAVREAFESAIRDLADSAPIEAIVERLEAGDVEGALRLIGADRLVFVAVADATAEAYRTAGFAIATSFRPRRAPDGSRPIFRFDVRAPRAEEYLRTEGARLVGGLTATAAESVRSSLREGLARGLNPRATALALAGRVSRGSNRREGGLIGLTPQQQEFVWSARDELLSGDPTRLKNYLGRTRRDARFDPIVKRAIEAERPVSAEDTLTMTSRYTDRLLQTRANNIARTETLAALHAGQHEAVLQAIERGALLPDDVTKTWRNARDTRVRDSHAALGGTRVSFAEPFISPVSGAAMRFPGDRSLGAGADEVANCRCHAQYKIDYLASVVRRQRAREIV